MAVNCLAPSPARPQPISPPAPPRTTRMPPRIPARKLRNKRKQPPPHRLLLLAPPSQLQEQLPEQLLARLLAAWALLRLAPDRMAQLLRVRPRIRSSCSSPPGRSTGRCSAHLSPASPAKWTAHPSRCTTTARNISTGSSSGIRSRTRRAPCKTAFLPVKAPNSNSPASLVFRLVQLTERRPGSPPANRPHRRSHRLRPPAPIRAFTALSFRHAIDFQT